MPCLFALWSALAGVVGACAPFAPQSSSSPLLGKEVVVEGDLAFALPPGYHEVVSQGGRTYRQRGAGPASFSTVHVQAMLPGRPVPLDEAFSLLISRLAEEEGLDILDVQLHFVGDELMLTYSAQLRFLDISRQQWGALVGRKDGLVALYFTAPTDAFEEAALDFDQVLASLHTL